MSKNVFVIVSLLFGAFQPELNYSTHELENETQRSGEITVQEAREALSQLIEEKSFLSKAEFLDPLRKRLKREIETRMLASVPSSSVYKGFSLGYWTCNTENNEFFHLTRSQDGSELFVIRGHFVTNGGAKWTAKMSEASRTRLFNPFGKKEYDLIQPQMTMDEVRKILKVAPGTYFTAEVAFDYHSGRRYWQFTGSGEKFRKDNAELFPNSGSEKGAFARRAWISNDMAIWVTFDGNGRVHRKEWTKVQVPNEPDEASIHLRKMVEELKKKGG